MILFTQYFLHMILTSNDDMQTMQRFLKFRSMLTTGMWPFRHLTFPPAGLRTIQALFFRRNCNVLAICSW